MVNSTTKITVEPVIHDSWRKALALEFGSQYFVCAWDNMGLFHNFYCLIFKGWGTFVKYQYHMIFYKGFVKN